MAAGLGDSAVVCSGQTLLGALSSIVGLTGGSDTVVYDSFV
jgi:hypothetical protein